MSDLEYLPAWAGKRPPVAAAGVDHRRYEPPAVTTTQRGQASPASDIDAAFVEPLPATPPPPVPEIRDSPPGPPPADPLTVPTTAGLPRAAPLVPPRSRRTSRAALLRTVLIFLVLGAIAAALGYLAGRVLIEETSAPQDQTALLASSGAPDIHA